MQKVIHNYLKTEKKSLLIAISVAILVVISYVLYLKFIGLPMTRAREKYTEGVILLNIGDKTEARIKFTESLSYWNTTEAQQALAKLN